MRCEREKVMIPLIWHMRRKHCIYTTLRNEMMALLRVYVVYPSACALNA
jgi:hypothetical protein